MCTLFRMLLCEAMSTNKLDKHYIIYLACDTKVILSSFSCSRETKILIT